MASSEPSAVSSNGSERVYHHRVRALTALTRIAAHAATDRMGGPPALLGAVVSVLPAMFRFPELTVARATLGNDHAVSPGWEEPTRSIEAHFRTPDRTSGTLVVGRKASATDPEQDFTDEERQLLVGLTDLVALHFVRTYAEQVAAERTDQLRETQALARVGTWHFDLTDGTYTASDGLYALHGITPPTGAHDWSAFIALIHPEDRNRAMRLIGEAFTRGTGFEVDHRIARPDGETRWVRSFGQPEYRITDGHNLLQGYTQDITDSRYAATIEDRVVELEHLNKTRAEFVNSAAHELNNPLTPITLQLDLLRSERIGPLTDKQHHTVDLIQRNLSRLATLVQDMLDSARLQAGRLQLSREATDLRAVVVDAYETYREAARRAGIDIELHADDALQTWSDPRRISQVLSNLIGNAVKFTPAGGRIHVRAESGVGEVRITVTDTGPGLTSHQIGELFQPFKQVHKEAVPKGTGLGLYISKGIIDGHGGRIWCESPGPEKGATFGFALPLAPPDGATPSDHAPASAPDNPT